MKSFFSASSFFAILFVVLFIALKAPAQRIGHYDENWKTIKTEHFDVVVNATQLDLGLYYARAAEMAFHNLATVFTNMTERIIIVVNDTTDVSNGFATRIPYPYIMAFSVPVGDHDALSESGDWAHILITHELTHILQFEPATGLYSYLRPVFGSIVAPNMLLPNWWKEGMAVEMETEFSNTGRLRSTFQDTTLRSMVLDKKLFDYELAQTGEALPSWPYGARPYLFGSLFFSQLVNDTKDPKSISYLVNRTGERAPYFVEEPMHELTGASYENLYNQALTQVQINGLAQIETLHTAPVSDVKPIVGETEYSLRPAYSPAFKLLALLESREDDATVAVLDENLTPLKLKDLPAGQISSLDFHPTQKKLLFAKTAPVDNYYRLSDLFIYDIDLQKSEQLTFRQRARSASFSDSGEQAVFITTEGGHTQIRTIDIKSKKIRFIINSTVNSRYESPIFWDDSTILASRIDENGRHRVVKIDTKSLVETETELDFRQARFLKKVKGRLYFVSSKNGVNNIYVSDNLKTAKPVTHLLSGSWSYAVDPDKKRIWASLLTSGGFRVNGVEMNEVDRELPIIDNLIKNRYIDPASTYSASTLRPTDYEASDYLLPSYWIPFISTSSSAKGIYFQAQTSGHDPLGLHQYALLASYDSELNKGNFNGVYTNSTQEIPFQISSVLKSTALGSNLNIVETGTHSVALLPDVFDINKNLIVSLGLQFQTTKFGTSSQHAGPFAALAYKEYSQNIFQISPEHGWGGFFRLEKNFKLADETNFVAQDYEKAQITLQGFSNEGLPKHHAVKGRLSALATFENVLSRFGSSSSSAFTEQDGLAPQFVMRGYLPAQFFGRNIWNTNLEYRFPVSTLERGSGTDAYFLKRIIGSVIVDGIGVDGYGQPENLVPLQPLKTNESIWSSGVEMKLETTIGNVLPVNFVLGYYLPFSPLYASSSQIGLSLQIGAFE